MDCDGWALGGNKTGSLGHWDFLSAEGGDTHKHTKVQAHTFLMTGIVMSSIARFSIDAVSSSRQHQPFIFMSAYCVFFKLCHNQNFRPSRTKENGFEREPPHPEHPSKRPCTISPGQRFSPSNGLSYQPNGLPHTAPPPPGHYRLDEMAIGHHYRDSYRHTNHREIRERPRPIGMWRRKGLWDTS